MSVFYSNVRFKRNSSHGAEVSRVDDVTYAEVKLTGSDPPPTLNRNRPAVSFSRETSVPTSYSYRLSAGCLGLLCVLLLTTIVALSVRYGEDHSSLTNNYSLIKSDMDQLQRNYSALTEENTKLQRNYSALTEEHTKLQRNYSAGTEANTKLQNEKNSHITSLEGEKRILITKLADIHSALANKIKFLPNCYNQSEEMVCDPCPKGWILEASKCYYFSKKLRSWTDSREYCTLQGADLVIIESEWEKGFINNMHDTSMSTWIGLKYTVEKREWLWVDKTALKSGDLASLQQDRYAVNMYAQCVYTLKNKWYLSSCFHKKTWICEIEALPPTLFSSQGEM